MKSPDVRACAVCGQVLERKADADGKPLGWFHFRLDAQDHIAVPVKEEEITPVYHCDFCDVILGEEVWTLPAESFRYPDLGLEDKHGSDGDWAMCAECKRCVVSQAWGRLVTRQMEGARRRNLPVPRAMYTAFTEDIRRHVTGPPYLGQPK